MNIKRFVPLIGIIILCVLLIRYDFAQWFDLAIQIPGYLLILTLFSSVIVVLVQNVEWQFLLQSQQMKVSFAYSLKNIFIGYFYGFITPGGIGGYTRALYLSHESKESVEKCVYNIGLINTIDIITLFIISIIGAFFYSNLYPLLGYSLLFFFILWIILLIILIHQKTWEWMVTILLRLTILQKYHQWITSSIHHLKTSLPSKKQILITMILSIIGWIIRFTLFYGVLRIFSIDVAYMYVIVIIAIANIIAMIPISIYGLGTRETVLISLFSLFSISPDVIIGVSLFWYVIIWVIPSMIGAVITLFEKPDNLFFSR